MTPPDVLAALLRLHWMRYDLMPRYNIAPTQMIAAVRPGDNRQRELVSMRWGLIPSWAKDVFIGSRLINARSETADAKPAFRQAFKRRRCVIPASGFYEWKRLDAVGKRKQPYYVARCDGSPMIMAGLWESWNDADSGHLLETCTILTTEPNAMLRDLHDRMPVVLDESGWDLWLDPTIDDADRLKAVLHAAPSEWFAMHPVSSRVNMPRHDDSSLIERVEVDAADPRNTGDGAGSNRQVDDADRRSRGRAKKSKASADGDGGSLFD